MIPVLAVLVKNTKNAMARKVGSWELGVARTIELCLLSAALLILSFPIFNLWILAWVAFIPLFFALQSQSGLKAFLLAYFTGVVFWAGTIYWLVHVTLLGTIILVLYLALYFGLFGLFFSYFQFRSASIDYRLSTIDPLVFSSIWVLLEYTRSHLLTGFPWALLGYSQCSNLPIIQIADLTGAYGVSFLVMMVNVAVYQFISQKSKVKSIFVPICCIFVSLIYGYYKLLPTSNSQLPTYRISVIQGNIPQDQKWEAESREYILNKYLTLSLAATKDNPDLVIWPEASLPVILEEEPDFFKEVRHFSQEAHLSLLIGAVTRRDDAYYNSAILVSKEGAVLGRYDKLHLVPFGEYIPLKNYLPFLETIVPIGDINPGKESTLFSLPTPNSGLLTYNKFAVLICFEDVFPELSRRFVKNGADFLVNITNDAWYKKTSAAYQHFQACVFRAVENRVFLVRAANTGISGFIAPTGKVISLVQDKIGKEIFVDGYKAQSITVAKRGLSFYSKYGDIFVLLLFALISLCSLVSLKSKNHV